eukprot:SAG22_NODE_6580_length_836_cov_0.839891_2_plen_28_part_01
MRRNSRCLVVRVRCVIDGGDAEECEVLP